MARGRVTELKNTVTWMAGVIAVVAALAIPLIYLLTAYGYERSRIQANAERQADIIAQFISANSTLWQSNQRRLQESLVQGDQATGETVDRRLVDVDGNVLAQVLGKPAAPRLTVSATVRDGPDVVANFEIIESIRHVYLRTALVAIFGIFIGGMTFFGVRAIPFRAIKAELAKREEAEKELILNEGRLKMAERLARVGNWEVDLSDGSVVWSDGLYDLFGVEKGSFVPTRESYTDLIFPVDRDRVLAEIRMAQRTRRPLVSEYRICRDDGAVRRIHQRNDVIFGPDGKPERVIGVLQDITERRETEEKARKYEADLAHVSRISTMGEMASGLAHEISQPLLAINSFADGCLRHLRSGTGNKQEIEEIIEEISVQATRAGAIIQRMREFLRKDKSKKKEIDLNAAVREVAELLAGEFQKRDVRMTLDLADDLPAVVADRIQIGQVLTNITRNGLEALSETGSAVREMKIATNRDDNGCIEVSVEDTGPGIGIENSEEIFEPFFTSREKGMGMGLSICRSIVESHGGKLRTATNLFGGATFSFTIPVSEQGR